MTSGKRILKRILIIVLSVAAVLFILVFISMKRMDIRKVDDWLYEIRVPHVSDRLVDKLLSDVDIDFGCTSFRKGDLYGRNYDWMYNNEVEFIVRTEGDATHYTSIGVASTTGLDRDFVESKQFSPYYYMLSCYVVDGINEKGVAANINIVPAGDAGYTTGTAPDKKGLCQLVTVRYILDYADSVESAIALLADRNVYAWQDSQGYQECHFMISDPKRTVIVEFVNNQMVVVEDENVMTNYYVSLPELTDYAEGMERYRIVKDGYDSVQTADDVLALLEKVYFTKAYDRSMDPFWYSDFYCHDLNFKGISFSRCDDPKDFEDEIDWAIGNFNSRTREQGLLWQTNHSCAYDLRNRTLDIIVQENGIKHHFELME